METLNLLLERTSPSVELIACLSDDLKINTKGWDSILLNYIYKNESKKIFRIRCSQYKNEKYKISGNVVLNLIFLSTQKMVRYR